MFFTTFPTVFGDEYGFSVGTTGLTYIGGGLGEIAAVVLGGYIADRIYHSVSVKLFRLPSKRFLWLKPCSSCFVVFASLPK